MSTYRADTSITVFKLLGASPQRRPEIIAQEPPFLIRTASIRDANALADLLTVSFHPQDGWMKLLHPILRLGIYEDLRHRLQSYTSPYACVIATYTPGMEGDFSSDNTVNPAEVQEAIAPSATLSEANPLDSSHAAESRIASTENASTHIIGTVEMSVKQRFWGCSRSKYVYLSNLATRPDYRRRGVASHLLRGCESMARRWGYQDICLHVLDNNKGARSLYQRLGYRIQQSDADLLTWFFNRPRQLLLHKNLQGSNRP